jgi:hypothetical protein
MRIVEELEVLLSSSNYQTIEDDTDELCRSTARHPYK